MYMVRLLQFDDMLRCCFLVFLWIVVVFDEAFITTIILPIFYYYFRVRMGEKGWGKTKQKHQSHSF